MLQCGAVRCSVLQCVAVSYRLSYCVDRRQPLTLPHTHTHYQYPIRISTNCPRTSSAKHVFTRSNSASWSKFSKVSSIAIICSTFGSELIFENLYQRAALEHRASHVVENFSNVRSIVILSSKLSSELTFENLYQRASFEHKASPLVENFSNVRYIVILCSKLSSELTFENFYHDDVLARVGCHCRK